MAAKEGPSRVACGVVAILLGAYGIHKFMLGQTTPGIIMLCVTVLTCFIGWIVMMPIGVIETVPPCAPEPARDLAQFCSTPLRLLAFRGNQAPSG